MPPEYPKLSNPRTIFYNLLRPELVISHSSALSSDTFSGWGQADRNKVNFELGKKIFFCNIFLEIKKLSEYVQTTTVKQIAVDLCNSALFPTAINEPFSIDLAKVMHQKGANIRHLGLVLEHITAKHQKLRRHIELEMIGRCIKQYVKKKMRAAMELSAFRDDTFRECCVQTLRTIFSDIWAVQQKWMTKLTRLMTKKFGSSVTPVTQKWKPTEIICFDVLKRTETQLGFKFSERLKESITKLHFSGFLHTDLESMKPKVKTTMSVSEAQGLSLMELGRDESRSREKANALFSEALTKLQMAFKVFFFYFFIYFFSNHHL
jgi:hypothetical protein